MPDKCPTCGRDGKIRCPECYRPWDHVIGAFYCCHHLRRRIQRGESVEIRHYLDSARPEPNGAGPCVGAAVARSPDPVKPFRTGLGAPDEGART